MSHDPFAAFNSEQTIIKPSLGRQKTTNNSAIKPNNSKGIADIQRLLHSPWSSSKGTTLSDMAGPFLRVSLQLDRISLERIQLPELKTIFVQALDKLESNLVASGRPNETRLATRYLVCTYLDEAVANTPWGGQSAWSQHSLLLHYFRETWGGEKVFILLDRFQEQPERNDELLRLFHLALSLGFKGKYHVLQDGNQLHTQLRAELAHTLNRTQKAPDNISLHWSTKITPKNRVLQQTPIWLVPAFCLTVGLIFFSNLYFQLNTQSDEVFEQVSMLKIAAPDLPRPEPTQAQKTLGEFLNERLAPEIQKGNLTVQYQNGYWVITLLGDGLFESGSDQINKAYQSTLDNVSNTLSATSGEIKVVGHTDSTPIRSLRYPSNWHLSSARANEVSNYLTNRVEKTRLSSEGAGAGEPLASNKTSEGRAMNRRVELWLSDPTQSAIL